MAFVQTLTNLLKLHFKDFDGNRATTQYHISTSETDPAGGGALAIANAAAALSADALTSAEIIVTAINDTPGTPTDGNWSRGADKAFMAFRTASGQDVILQVGAPLLTTIAPDRQYVDPTDTHVAALIAAMIAHGCDESGAAIKAFQRGYRRRPAHRKHA